MPTWASFAGAQEHAFGRKEVKLTADTAEIIQGPEIMAQTSSLSQHTFRPCVTKFPKIVEAFKIKNRVH